MSTNPKIDLSYTEVKKFEFTENTNKFKKEIEELANELAFNHLANSFGDMPDQPPKCKFIFSKEKLGVHTDWYDPDYFGKFTDTVHGAFEYRKQDPKRSCRNILIIGAGASFDSYPYIPLGGTLREKLENSFEQDIAKSDKIKSKYNEEKRNIERLSKWGYDFENCLSLLSNFIPATTLRTTIQELTSFTYEPSLLYEIIAHLFKHNFIDVIVNFNFDELLDNAIEEELGAQNYHHIVHNGDCPTLTDLLEDSRLKVPIYIKPHGTSTHTTTLRFTKQHYLDIPPEIENLLKSLIGGERESNNKIKRVNLICVGFDLTSLEFNEILNHSLPEESRIYHIAHGNSKVEVRKRCIEVDLKKCMENDGGKRFITIDIEKFDQNDTLITPYAEIFSVLWRSIYIKFQEMYRPRSIGRHEILTYLFYRKEKKTNPEQYEYFRIAKKGNIKSKRIREYFVDRVLVEIALSLHRSGGIVDVIHLLNGRIGEYYGLYRWQAEICKDDKIYSIYELLGEFTDEAELNSDVNQSEFIYSKNVFRVMPFETDKLIELFKQIRKGKHFIGASANFYDMFESEVNHVYNKNPITATILIKLFFSNKLSKDFKEKLLKDYNLPINNGLLWDDQPKPLLKEIFRLFSKSAPKNYFYIRSSRNDRKNHMWESFEKRNLLLTTLSYKYHFRTHFLNHERWDIILCISETGSLIDFLDILVKNQEDYKLILDDLREGRKRIVIICSYENVRQLHCASGEEKNVSELINIHRSYLAGGVSNIWKETNIDLLLLPYWQHNHHSILFLKKVESNTVGDQRDAHHYFNVKDEHTNNIDKWKGFILNRSYYYYKKGFSNSINPIFFRRASNKVELDRLRNDQLKLLSLYFTYVCRSIIFLSGVNTDEDWFEKLSPCFKNIASLEEYQQYTLWTPEQFDNKLVDFLTFIYYRSYDSN